MNKATYDAVGNHFRKLWGQEAGWAHSVLFTADLRSFADRLAETKKVKVTAKDKEEDVEIKTEVTTAVALTAPKEEDIKVKTEPSEIKPATKASRGKKRKGSPGSVVHTAQTSETRRMSKRLRK